jgi:prepilin-type N-terminal cleavage/methylation domain-containing protein
MAPMPHRRSKGGFSLVEVMVAMAIIAVGLVSMLALFAHAVAIMQLGQENLIARQKAKETMESIYAARDSGGLTFDSINNTTTTPGIFLPGFRNLTIAGADGLLGTADDGPIEVLVTAGPDGLLGTSDDVTRPLVNFQRQITVAPFMIGTIPHPDLKIITVTIRYSLPKGGLQDYTVTSYISRFR